MTSYSKTYEGLKPTRQLAWKPNLGTVNIDLEFGDKSLNFNVTPLQATIIYYFQDREIWSLNDLSEATQMQADALKKKISFWVNQGILKEIEKNVFELVQSPIEKAQQGN